MPKLVFSPIYHIIDFLWRYIYIYSRGQKLCPEGIFAQYLFLMTLHAIKNVELNWKEENANID